MSNGSRSAVSKFANTNDGDSGDIVATDDLPWKKVEGLENKIRDDDESFPTMGAWAVSFTDPKDIKPLQEYLKARPLLWESLQHLKLIRKEVLESGANRFQMLVGTSSTMPDDIPQGDYSIPELCQVPATPALTRTQLKLKNALWPSIFSPHLLPKEIQFSRSEVIRAEQGIKMALEEAKRASVLGELSIGACLLPDQHLSTPLLAHDTCSSTRHPLRHATMNLVRELADRMLQAPTSPESKLEPDEAANTQATPPPLQNGEGYQLTNKTLFITHEPCLMCTMALVHSRVKEIFYIYPMSQTGGCGGRTIVSELPTINHRFNIWQWKEETLQLLGSDIGYIPAIPATVHV